MTSVEHMAVGPRPASLLPQKTDLVYLAPPIQPGSTSISTSASKIRLTTLPQSSIRHKISIRVPTQTLEANLWRRLARKQPHRRSVKQPTNFLLRPLSIPTRETVCQASMI
ncbi:hypothetical protein BDR07DRAFT_268069 [Suillus spraguei]|nr:hypothetical protein BDR07DRAFT_268069 [Suillus spraguei]